MNGILTAPSLKCTIYLLICLVVPLVLSEKIPSFDDVGLDKLVKSLKFQSTFPSDEWKLGNEMFKDKIFNLASETNKKAWLSDGSESFANHMRAALKLDPDARRNLTQLIVSQGYPVERYVVQTKDGFLLDLHRIPYGRKNSTSKGPRTPVFLQHGLLSSGSDWVMNFPNNSLGFILSDHGYDVWLGNSRGNTYSQKHIRYSPHQKEFWNWSFDEMAKYDLPAFIDFVLKKTNQSQLHYVGHSQGTIMAYAAFSQQPELQKKIRLYVALAPIISINHIVSPLKYMSLLTDQEGYDLLGRKAFLPSNILMKILADTVCNNKLSSWVCYNIVFLMAGYDIGNLNQSRLAVYINHTPAGASVKDMVHYAQWYRTKRFVMYDYGSPSENQKHYKQDTPPAYNASKVNVPSILFTANNDWLADPTDVQTLLHTVKNIHKVYNFPKWNHLDFVWGLTAGELCYSKILEWLPKF